MSVCRSCGQTIHWIELVSGKRMPCDMEEVSTNECEIGDILVTLDGRTIKINETSKREDGYVSHFSTCPQSDEWRTSSRKIKA